VLGAVAGAQRAARMYFIVEKNRASPDENKREQLRVCTVFLEHGDAHSITYSGFFPILIHIRSSTRGRN